MERLALLAALLLALAPGVAQACSVCFSATDEARLAFLGTTIFMSVLPVALIVGAGLWLRRRLLEAQQRDAAAFEARS